MDFRVRIDIASVGGGAVTGVLRLLDRIDRRVAAVELAVAVASLSVALVVPLYAIAMRALRAPTGEWVLELPTEALMVLAVYGSGFLLAEHGHMRVDVLVERLSPRRAAVVATAIELGVMALSVTITARAIAGAADAARIGLRSHELFGVPVALFTAIAAAGFAGWTFHAAVGVIRRLGGLASGRRVAVSGA